MPARAAEAGAGAPEVEVTPAMRKAGASVLQELSGVVDSECLPSAVYIAMAGISGSKQDADR